MATLAELQSWEADVQSAQSSITARQAQIAARAVSIDTQFPTWSRSVAYQVERRTVNWLAGHLAHLAKLAATKGRYLTAQALLVQNSQPSATTAVIAPASSDNVSAPVIQPSTNVGSNVPKKIGPPSINYLFP